MAVIAYELFCNKCNHEWTESEENERCYECPKCHSEQVFKDTYLVCSCGTKVYISKFTNECYNCEKLYNNCGQELADPDEWDDEDKYACFGPQNDYDN